MKHSRNFSKNRPSMNDFRKNTDATRFSPHSFFFFFHRTASARDATRFGVGWRVQKCSRFCWFSGIWGIFSISEAARASCIQLRSPFTASSGRGASGTPTEIPSTRGSDSEGSAISLPPQLPRPVASCSRLKMKTRRAPVEFTLNARAFTGSHYKLKL